MGSFRLPVLVVIAVAIAASLFGWALQPVKLHYQKEENSNKLLIGTEINTPPIFRFLNGLSHPFRRRLLPLDPEALKQRAIESFGDGTWTDFGKHVHWEAYEKFLQVADEDCHFVGRYFIRETVQNSLRTHLWMTKKFKEHPDIEDEIIDRPIFFAAFTRVGATFMLQVVSDLYKEELRPTPQYEIMNEGPFWMDEEEQQEDPRPESIRQTISIFNYLNPVLTKLHEWTDPYDIDEEAGWYGWTFCGLANAFALPSPYHSTQFGDPQSTCNEMHHPFLKTVLQIKQWQQKNEKNPTGKKMKERRFVLKSPEHLQALPKLLEVFPDAYVIALDRTDITRKFQSSMAITHHFRQLFVTKPNLKDTLLYNELLICGELEAIASATDNTTYQKNVLHLQAPKIFTQTMEETERVAHFAGLPWDDEVTPVRARGVIENRRRWKLAESEYKIEEYGLSDEIIQDKLSRCHSRPRTYEEWLERDGPSKRWEL